MRARVTDRDKSHLGVKGRLEKAVHLQSKEEWLSTSASVKGPQVTSGRLVVILVRAVSMLCVGMAQSPFGVSLRGVLTPACFYTCDG